MISRNFAADFLPTAELTNDAQEHDRDVKENGTNLAEALLVDSSFEFRLHLLFSAESAHAENSFMRPRSLFEGENLSSARGATTRTFLIHYQVCTLSRVGLLIIGLAFLFTTLICDSLRTCTLVYPNICLNPLLVVVIICDVLTIISDPQIGHRSRRSSSTLYLTSNFSISISLISVLIRRDLCL